MEMTLNALNSYNTLSMDEMYDIDGGKKLKPQAVGWIFTTWAFFYGVGLAIGETIGHAINRR